MKLVLLLSIILLFAIAYAGTVNQENKVPFESLVQTEAHINIGGGRSEPWTIEELKQHFPNEMLLEEQNHAKRLEEVEKWGGGGGNPWDDANVATAPIRSIQVRSGAYVDAITTLYGSSWTPQHGGNGGGFNSINFAAGECINAIRVRQGAFIDQIAFKTVLTNGQVNEYGPYGGGGGSGPYTDIAPAGQCLLSMFGRSGAFVDNINFRWGAPKHCSFSNGGCSSYATCAISGTGRTCACNSGFSGNGITCQDIDECATNNGGCNANAVCVNTLGSRTCSCKPGFTGDGMNCVDINECATNNGGCAINAQCTNTPGSRTCSCSTGYTGDGVTCALYIVACEGTTATASCPAGYNVNVLSARYGRKDRVICPHATVPSSGCIQCQNNIATRDVDIVKGLCNGKNTCSVSANNGVFGDPCVGMYKYLVFDYECIDINECATNNGGCDSNAVCANTIGSRTCTCKPGWTGSGVTCVDVNECLVSNGGCSSGSQCVNTAGSRTCSCKFGYTLASDGVSCTPKDVGFALMEFGTVTKKTPWDTSSIISGRPYTETVSFSRAFPSVPDVFMTIYFVDVEHTRSSYRISVSASSITTTGFVANLETWADTILYTVHVNWFAYLPVLAPTLPNFDFDGGMVLKTTPWDTSSIILGRPFTATQSFGKAFQATPNVYLATTVFDIESSRNMRISLSADQVTSSQFRATFQTWADTIAYTVHATYFAVAPVTLTNTLCKYIQVKAGRVLKPTPWTTYITPSAPCSIPVNFGFTFNSVPTVLLSPYAIDTPTNVNFRLNVKATSVTTTGFVAVFETWANTFVYTVHATWLAYAPVTLPSTVTY